MDTDVEDVHRVEERTVADVVKVFPVLVERARQHVRQLEAEGKTAPVALRRIAEARTVVEAAPSAA